MAARKKATNSTTNDSSRAKEVDNTALEKVKKDIQKLSKAIRGRLIIDPLFWNCLTTSGTKQDRKQVIDMLEKSLQPKKGKKADTTEAEDDYAPPKKSRPKPDKHCPTLFDEDFWAAQPDYKDDKALPAPTNGAAFNPSNGLKDKPSAPPPLTDKTNGAAFDPSNGLKDKPSTPSPPADKSNGAAFDPSNGLEEDKDDDVEATDVVVIEPVRRWEANPWKVAMAQAEKFLKKMPDHVREHVCIQVLKDVQAWQPKQAVPRIFACLHQMQSIQKAMPNTEKKKVALHIQIQVAGIVTARADDISRLSLFFWLAQMASTVNAYEANGKTLTVGRGQTSIIYDQYVEAEFGSHKEYEAAKKSNAAQLHRMRENWKRRKEVGGKVLRLTRISVSVLL